MSKRCVFAIAAAASVLLGGAAGAQSLSASGEKAQGIFDRAKLLMEAGRYDEACPLFAESHALDPQVGALLNLAFCYQGWHRTASAWLIWLKAAEEADALGEAARAEFARQRARELEPGLLRVTVTVAPQATSAAIGVALDRAPLDREHWGTAIPLDEGEHEVVAGGEGVQRWSSRFVVAPGQGPADVRVPALSPVAAAGTAHDATRPEEGGSVLRPIAWAVGGVGVAALGVGAAFGVAGIVHKNDSTQNGNCVVAQGGSNNCNPTGTSDVSRARQDMQFADVSYAMGGGLLVTAVLLWCMGRRAPEPPMSAAHIAVQPSVTHGSWSVAVDGAW